MASFSSPSCVPFQVQCCFPKPSNALKFYPTSSRQFISSLKVNVSKFVKNNCIKLLDSFVDSTFDFVDLPLPSSLSSFAPVDELGRAAVVTDDIHGIIPSDFPQGVYIRNGPNPLFGGLKSTKSIFGRSGPVWVEGEGMLHALYFSQDINGSWTVIYNNRHVETETFMLEKQRNKPSFLPSVQGDPIAVFSSYLLNLVA